MCGEVGQGLFGPICNRIRNIKSGKYGHSLERRVGVEQQHGLIEGCSLEERFGVFLGLMRGVGIFVNSLEKLASNSSCLELVDGWP